MTLDHPMRPICPSCGKEMVYLVTNAGPEKLQCFVCDCQNEHLAEDIRECRLDHSPEASLCVIYEAFEEEETLPPIPPDKAQYILQYYCPN
jgi:hypothetical protein